MIKQNNESLGVDHSQTVAYCKIFPNKGTLRSFHVGWQYKHQHDQSGESQSFSYTHWFTEHNYELLQ